MKAYALCSLLFIFLFATLSQAFSFTNGSPGQCDDLKVDWTDGGQAPFQLLISPLFGTPRNISIPTSAQGTFTVPQLALPTGQTLVLTMSDSTGFGTGGSSAILTVGSSVSGQSCNTADVTVDFSFQLNTPLQQCRPYTFSGYGGAVQPITIMGVIPGGETFILRPPTGAQFDWTANVAADTPIVFVMIDSQGRQGGASRVQTVGANSDVSCLSADSPSITIGTGSTSTARSGPSNRSSSTSGPSPTGSSNRSKATFSIGAIAGSAIGGLIVLAILVTLGLFYLRKRSARSNGASPYPYGGPRPQSSALHTMGKVSSNTPPSRPDPYPMSTSASASTALLTDNRYSPVPQGTPTHQAPMSTPASVSAALLNDNRYSLASQGMPAHQAPYGHNQYDPSYNPFASPSTSPPPPPQQHLQAQPQSYYPQAPPPQPQPLQAQAQPSFYPQAPPPQPQPQPSYFPPTGPPYGSNAFNVPVPSQSGNAYNAPSPPPGGNAYNASIPPSHAASSSQGSMSYAASDAARRKAEMAAAESSQRQAPTRFVLHTDLDEVAAPNADGVIELPPQYSESRVPLVGLQAASAAQGAQAPQQHQHNRSHSGDSGLAYLNG